MKCAAGFALTLVALVAASDGPDVSHPVGKVIRMLQGLSMKVEMDGKMEAITYGKFEYWCRNSEKELATAIAKSQEEEATLTDSIESQEQREKTLTEEIDDLTDEISKLQASAIKAQKIRDDTAKEYNEAMADFTGTLTAIGEGIDMMVASKDPTLLELNPSVRTALALLDASPLGVQQHASIAAFLQRNTAGTSPAPAAAPYGAKERPDLVARGGLEEHVQKYAFKSDNVIELLKELKLKFEDEKTAAETAETNSLNAYALAKQARDASELAASSSKTEKEKVRGEVQADLIQLKSDLKSCQDDLASDTATQESTKKSCVMKKEEWDERSAVREQEREAMAMAVKILAKVSGVRTEAPSNPVPPAAPTGFLSAAVSLLQVENQSPEQKAMSLLRSASHATHSKALARLADEISIEPHGHFGAVINSIEKMIFKLQDEQMDEDKHKAWCDKEDSETKASLENKNDKFEELEAKINVDASTIQELTTQISEADDMVADIVKFMAEATEIRNTGKHENKVALKESEEAQEAIASATAVLTTFYKESGMIEKDAFEFVQQPVDLPANPATWDSSYVGVANPKAQPQGIVSVLSKCGEDFAKMEADTRAQEATDESDYQDQMSKSTIDKARRAKESEMKGLEKKGVSDRMAALQKTKKHVSDERESVQQYLKDLEPACVTGDSTYDDRKAARKDEITALHEAQAILADAFKEASAKSSFLSVRRH